MRYGVTFSHPDMGDDPGFFKEFAQSVEGAGFDHLVAAEHVIGGHPDRLTAEKVHTYDVRYHEPFVLFGYLGAVTSRIELVTGILILPQRQTALVAKQAAEIDLLSGERLRLGIGLGWNYVEYESLNEDFSNKGKRVVEQVDLLRRLWTEDLLDYRGEWHRIDRASILPRPNRQIPIWFGGFQEPALKRAARIGDGFIFSGRPERLIEAAERLRGYLADAGRESEPFGFEAFVEYGRPRENWLSDIEEYERAGFTHVAMRSINAGLPGPQAHIDLLAEYAAAVGVRPSEA
jgi:probable F420-dependent oxidoreductase